ncbi:MAG: T9SS type A sorting domain-containing protein [Bacteroidota bacterium]
MKRLFLLFASFTLLIPFAVHSQVTFSKDIAPIVYNNCTTCHRSGEVGPMAFTNYEEVAAWATMIEYVTSIRYMPPWPADPAYRHFVGERTLSEEDIQLIADWVNTGAPQGDPALEPPLPTFPSGSQLGVPDLVLEMEEPYLIEGNNQDDYRVFVLPTGLTEDKGVTAVEFRPGNKRAVHHALIAYETDGEGQAKDAESPNIPGYNGFGGFNVDTEGNFDSYTPGKATFARPGNIGYVLEANSDILVQVHYAPLPTDETDQSKVNVFFNEVPVSRPIEQGLILPIHLPGGFGGFQIPPNEVTTFHGTRFVFDDISLISVYPHCHLLGQKWEVYAVSPTGDTINIIRINEWDFNWQGDYTFEHLLKIPAGSVIHTLATYDNTINNPFNPSNPPQYVYWGDETTAEMYILGFTFVPYQNGDENISLDADLTTSTSPDLLITKNKLFPPYPNPVADELTVGFSLAQQQTLSLSLFDIEGQLVRLLIDQQHYPADLHQAQFSMKGLAPGNYVLKLEGPDFQLSEQVVIIHKGH